jgi:hypothetical protein
MHGGGFQSTEWFDTPDGRPGWAERSIEAGYTVLAVDRPGHVRSLLHTAIMGGMSPPSPMSMDTISTFWKRDVQSRRSGTWPETTIRRWPARPFRRYGWRSHRRAPGQKSVQRPSLAIWSNSELLKRLAVCLYRINNIRNIMNDMNQNRGKGEAAHSSPPKPKFGAGSLILIGCCVAAAIVGIFIGVIVVYGGSQTP